MTTENTLQGNPLLKCIDHGEFLALSDADAIKLFHEAFGPELERLKNASSTAESGPVAKPESDDDRALTPSQQLYGVAYTEVDRSLVAMLALKWVMSKDYDTFTCYQIPPIKLRQESFEKLGSMFNEGLRSSSDIYALLVATVINDLGKESTLAADVTAVTGQSMIGLNHDMIVYAAANAGMVPCLQTLDPSYREDIMLGLQFGSELNVAQLAQAENVPGSLKGALILRGHENAFTMKFLEVLLDVAGAAGHIDARCAKPMIEPVFQAFMVTRDVLLNIINERCTLRSGYDQVLTNRGQMLQTKGFRSLSVDVPSQRALLRLLTMGRTTSKEQAEWFAQAFNDLPEPVRHALIDGLSVDGYEDGKAILPYFMPALFAEGLKNTTSTNPSAKEHALGSLFRFLARVYEGTKPARGQQGVVCERNLLFAKETIQSEAFKTDPRVLDSLDIPVKD